MIADAIIVAVFVLFVIIGVKRGIAVTFLNIVALVVTAVSAYYLSQMLSQLIYDSFVKQTVIINLEQTIKQSGAQNAVNNCFNSLPKWVMVPITEIMSLFGVNSQSIAKTFTITQGTVESTANSVERLLAPVVTGVFEFILIIILFILILIIAKKINKHLLKLFNIPVIRQLNNFLGGVLGAAEGIIFIWIGVNVFYAVMYFSNPAVVSDNMFCGALFKFFCIAS